jgi:hypothetical protein
LPPPNNNDDGGGGVDDGDEPVPFVLPASTVPLKAAVCDDRGRGGRCAAIRVPCRGRHALINLATVRASFDEAMRVVRWATHCPLYGVEYEVPPPGHHLGTIAPDPFISGGPYRDNDEDEDEEASLGSWESSPRDSEDDEIPIIVRDKAHYERTIERLGRLKASLLRAHAVDEGEDGESIVVSVPGPASDACFRLASIAAQFARGRWFHRATWGLDMSAPLTPLLGHFLARGVLERGADNGPEYVRPEDLCEGAVSRRAALSIACAMLARLVDPVMMASGIVPETSTVYAAPMAEPVVMPIVTSNVAVTSALRAIVHHPVFRRTYGREGARDTDDDDDDDDLLDTDTAHRMLASALFSHMPHRITRDGYARLAAFFAHHPHGRRFAEVCPTIRSVFCDWAAGVAGSHHVASRLYDDTVEVAKSRVVHCLCEELYADVLSHPLTPRSVAADIAASFALAGASQPHWIIPCPFAAAAVRHGGRGARAARPRQRALTARPCSCRPEELADPRRPACARPMHAYAKCVHERFATRSPAHASFLYDAAGDEGEAARVTATIARIVACYEFGLVPMDMAHRLPAAIETACRLPAMAAAGLADAPREIPVVVARGETAIDFGEAFFVATEDVVPPAFRHAPDPMIYELFLAHSTVQFK